MTMRTPATAEIEK